MYGARYGIGAPGVVSEVNGPFPAPSVVSTAILEVTAGSVLPLRSRLLLHPQSLRFTRHAMRLGAAAA